MLSGIFVMIKYVPVASASAPASPVGNVVYENVSFSGDINAGSVNSGSVTLSSTPNEQFKVTSFTKSGDSYLASISLGSFYYDGTSSSSPSYILSDVAFQAPYNSATGDSGFSALFVEISFSGSGGYAESWLSGTNGVPTGYTDAQSATYNYLYLDPAEANHNYLPLSGGVYSATLSVNITAASGYGAPAFFQTTTTTTGASSIDTTLSPNYAAINTWGTGAWSYTSQTVSTGSRNIYR